MTSAAVQVERLEALLARVQRNRTQPRADSGENGRPRDEVSFEGVTSQRPAPEPVQPAQARPPAPLAPLTSAPEMSAPPVPRPPMRATTEPIAASGPGASRPARTPLEMAVEHKLDRPSTHPHLQPAPSAAPAVPQPVSFARPAADEPVMLVDPTLPQASRGIGQVVSKSPLIGAQSFGDLLRRSLSLRPR